MKAFSIKLNEGVVIDRIQESTKESAVNLGPKSPLPRSFSAGKEIEKRRRDVWTHDDISSQYPCPDEGPGFEPMVDYREPKRSGVQIRTKRIRENDTVIKFC